ncbi:MAG: galactose oxidase early set domain-containing protein, partial [Actinomycetota bacterium]
PRPAIALAPGTVAPGTTFDVVLEGNQSADDVSSVMLMRQTAITHLVDGGQRGVELEVVGRTGNVLTVAMPSSAAVTPAGPYLLFVNADHGEGPTPSEAQDLMVTAPAAAPVTAAATVTGTATAASTGSSGPVDLSATEAVPVDAEIAFHEILELRGHDPASHSHALPAGDDRSTPATAVAIVAALAALAGWTFTTRRHRHHPPSKLVH